jgi:hypothetical protein
LAKEHPGKILELYPLLDGSLMIACFVWQKRCLQFQWFIVLSRLKKHTKTWMVHKWKEYVAAVRLLTSKGFNKFQHH